MPHAVSARARSREPSLVQVEHAGRTDAAEVLECNGHRAALRSATALDLHAAVRLQLGWRDGAHTTLPAVVRAVGPAGAAHLAHVELTGVEGAWEPFLAWVGPSLATE